MTSAPSSAPPAVRRAALVTALEAVALVVLGGVDLYLAVTGTPGSRGVAVGEGVVVLAVAALLAVLARGLLHRSRPALTPTLLIQVLALPVGYNLLRHGQPIAGVGVGLPALAVLVLLLGNPAARDAFR